MRSLTENIGNDLSDGLGGILSVLEQLAAMVGEVTDVSLKLVTEGDSVSLDGIDEVAEVSLEGASESGDDL